MSTCRSCGEPVTWATTEGRPDKPSKRIPLDPQPHPDGTHYLRPRGDGSMQAVHVPVLERAACPHQRYRTHFATCPQADRHRRGGR